MNVIYLAHIPEMGSWDWQHIAALGAIGVLCLWVLRARYKQQQYSFYKLQGTTPTF
jgi:hypothetical protein